jgi:hypothetical protein
VKGDFDSNCVVRAESMAAAVRSILLGLFVTTAATTPRREFRGAAVRRFPYLIFIEEP